MTPPGAVDAVSTLPLPHFLIGGAPRSGTTWLYRLLERHPGIWMARPVRPEPKFFLMDDLYAKGLEHYARTWFAEAPRGAVLGEKSTNYLESPAAARRVGESLPSVRVVFILREPVERAWSNWLWSRMNGKETETFPRALTLEEERERTCPADLRYARPHAYFSRGLYADQLDPWFVTLPRDRILCLRFEDIAEDPAAVAARLHAFLGVPVRPGDAGGLGVVNAAEKDGAVLEENVRVELRRRYREPNRRLAALLGPGFRVWEDA